MAQRHVPRLTRILGEPNGLVQDRLFPNKKLEDLTWAERRAEVRYHKRLAQSRLRAQKKYNYALKEPVVWGSHATYMAENVWETKGKRVVHFIFAILGTLLATLVFLFLFSNLRLGQIASDGDKDLAASIFYDVLSLIMSWAPSALITLIFTALFRMGWEDFRLTPKKSGERKNGASVEYTEKFEPSDRYNLIKMREHVRYSEPITGTMDWISRWVTSWGWLPFLILFVVYEILHAGYFSGWGQYFSNAYGNDFWQNWVNAFVTIFPFLSSIVAETATPVSVETLFMNPIFDLMISCVVSSFTWIAFQCVRHDKVCKCCKTVHSMRHDVTITVTRAYKQRRKLDSSNEWVTENYTQIITTKSKKYTCEVCGTYNGTDTETKKEEET